MSETQGFEDGGSKGPTDAAIDAELYAERDVWSIKDSYNITIGGAPRMRNF